MRNKGFVFALFLAPLFFASCTVYVESGNTAGGPPVTTLAANTTYAVNNVVPEEETTLKVYDNRFVFFRMNEPVAVWIMTGDGLIIKKGAVIDGLVRMYYAPGKIGAEIMYRNNRREGMYRTYYPNGRIFESGFYKAGIKEGAWQRFNAEGMLMEDNVFARGVKRVVYQREKKFVFNNEWNFDDLNREENYTRIKTGTFKKEEAFPKKFKRQYGNIPEYNKDHVNEGGRPNGDNHNWNNDNKQNNNDHNWNNNGQNNGGNNQNWNNENKQNNNGQNNGGNNQNWNNESKQNNNGQNNGGNNQNWNNENKQNNNGQNNGGNSQAMKEQDMNKTNETSGNAAPQEQHKSPMAVGYRANNPVTNASSSGSVTPTGSDKNAGKNTSFASVTPNAKADRTGNSLNGSYSKTTQTAKGPGKGKQPAVASGNTLNAKAEPSGNSKNVKSEAEGNSPAASAGNSSPRDSSGNSGNPSSDAPQGHSRGNN